MKIVMLCDLYDERLQYQENLLAKYYAKAGHDVLVVAATFDSAADYIANRYDPSRPAREYQDGPVRVIKLPYQLNLLNRLRRFPGIAELLERERPDLVFVHDIHLNLREAARYRRDHPKTRLILDYHADYSNSARSWLSLKVLHGVIRKRFFDRHRASVDQLYAVVPASATFLSEVYGVRPEAIELLPLGSDVDLARQARANGVRSDLRRRFGIPDDAVAIFTGGKLNPEKKTHLLLEAMRELRDLPIHLLVVGDLGPERSAYRVRLEELIAADSRIHAAGWVPGSEVYGYMAAADVAVFPASQSVLWQQALSVGLPLIVGPTPGQDCDYLNRHDNLVMLASPQPTATALAIVIREHVVDRGLLARRQVGALRVTDELLDYHHIVQRTLTIKRP